MGNRKIEKRALIFATKTEAEKFFQNENLSLLEKKPFKIYQSEEYLLLISGIGKYNAITSVTYLTSVYGIKNIVNIGAAGALSEKFKFADILTVESVLDISNQHKYILTNKEAVNNICCATVDEPVFSDIQRSELSEKAEIVDMEAAGFAYASQKFDIELKIVKHISDTSGISDKKEIIENIRILSKSMYDNYNLMLKNE